MRTLWIQPIVFPRSAVTIWNTLQICGFDLLVVNVTRHNPGRRCNANNIGGLLRRIGARLHYGLRLRISLIGLHGIRTRRTPIRLRSTANIGTIAHIALRNGR